MLRHIKSSKLCGFRSTVNKRLPEYYCQSVKTHRILPTRNPEEPEKDVQLTRQLCSSPVKIKPMIFVWLYSNVFRGRNVTGGRQAEVSLRNGRKLPCRIPCRGGSAVPHATSMNLALLQCTHRRLNCRMRYGARAALTAIPGLCGFTPPVYEETSPPNKYHRYEIIFLLEII